MGRDGSSLKKVLGFVWKHFTSTLLILVVLILFIPSWRLNFQVWFNGLFMSDIEFVAEKGEYNSVNDFPLFNSEDHLENFYDYKGKPTLVSFWRTWCGPCRAELPKIKEFYEGMGSKINIVSLTNEEFEIIHQADIPVEEYPFIRFAPYYDEAFEVNAFPTLFLLNSELEIIDRHEGTGKLLTEENIALINSLISETEN